MPSARTVVLYTLLWARPERLGAGFSWVAGKWRSPLPGPSWLRQRAGRARVGPEACRRASRALEDARMQGWRAWGSELAKGGQTCERQAVCALL